MPEHTGENPSKPASTLRSTRTWMLVLGPITGGLGVLRLVTGSTAFGMFALAFACFFVVMGLIVLPRRIAEATDERRVE